MKTFASIAILAASAAAVNTQVAADASEYTTTVHSHEEPVIHVDIWEQIAG